MGISLGRNSTMRRYLLRSGGVLGVIGVVFLNFPITDAVSGEKSEVVAVEEKVLEEEPINIEELLTGMSLTEKVGQLMIVGFGGTKVDSHISKWIRDRKVGGVILFARNIVDLEQIARFTRELHELTRDGIPLFLGLDQEGGNVIRLKDGAMLLPGNMALGASRSPMLSYVAGQGLAIDLARVGFNMNLAPVLDVNSNPRNPVIGVRSYGERADLVGALGAWFVRGQQEMGIAGVAKHFPGHGNTFGDSHFSMPSSYIDRQRLFELELSPFRTAIDAGLDAIMTAHIALPRITESPRLPATLSKNVITNILRGDLGFEGVVMTDGLEMQGIVEKYGTGKAAVKAILAGADMPMVLWTAQKKESVYNSITEAVENGTISVERLNQSVRRILRLKKKRGIFKRDLVNYDSVVRGGNYNPVHEQVTQRIAREAVTLVRNHGDMLPLSTTGNRKIVVMAPQGEFTNRLAREKNITIVRVPSVPSRTQREDGVARILRAAQDVDGLVLVAINRYHVSMIAEIVAKKPDIPTAFISFASPYYLSSVPSADAYVCTYSYSRVAQIAAAQALLGETRMTGRLPVSIPGFYSYGHRVEDRIVALPVLQ